MIIYSLFMIIRACLKLAIKFSEYLILCGVGVAWSFIGLLFAVGAIGGVIDYRRAQRRKWDEIWNKYVKGVD